MRITYAPWGETIDELGQVARRAELAGATALWVPELYRSATIPAAAMAAVTDSATVGTSIALAFTRSPMVTALEALDINELASGRFVLGLGTGVKRLNEDWHNSRWGQPVGHMKETVRNIRQFWQTCTTGGEIDLPGDYEPMRIRGYKRPFDIGNVEIPIYLASMGPVMTRLAGSIADGWISHELCSPKYLAERILPELHTGIAQTAGKSRSDVDVVVSACCSISADRRIAKDQVRGLVGFYASVRTYADFFAFHDLSKQHEAVVEAFRGGYGAEHLADSVEPELVDALTFTGTRDDVASRIAEYRGIADSIKLSPPTHGLSGAETRAAQDEILNLIADLTGGST